jgi:hypothetical protein
LSREREKERKKERIERSKIASYAEEIRSTAEGHRESVERMAF